jgi:hypothetical protein
MDQTYKITFMLLQYQTLKKNHNKKKSPVFQRFLAGIQNAAFDV